MTLFVALLWQDLRVKERVGSDSTADSGSLPGLVRATKLTFGAGKQYVRAAEMQK